MGSITGGHMNVYSIWSSEIGRHVVLQVGSDVSEEPSASAFRI
jgi:hypothetical protein